MNLSIRLFYRLPEKMNVVLTIYHMVRIGGVFTKRRSSGKGAEITRCRYRNHVPCGLTKSVNNPAVSNCGRIRGCPLAG